MNSAKQVVSYMNEHFPGLELSPPLFYKTPIGIRFEIGSPYRAIDDPAYASTVYLRSILLFKEVFSEDDEVLLVIKSYKCVEPYVCFNQGEDVFPKYLKNIKLLSQIDCVKQEEFDEDSGELCGYSYEYSLICKREDLDYKGLLKAIGNMDLPYKPFVSDGVYFINTSRHLIYHLYDDRGLDLVAESKQTLAPIYVKYNDWILNYDREQIDKVFGGF